MYMMYIPPLKSTLLLFMATLRKRGNTWYASYRPVKGGKQMEKSTGFKVNPTDMTPAKAKKLAKEVAERMEQAARGSCSATVAMDAFRASLQSQGLMPVPTVKDLMMDYTVNATAQHLSNINRARMLFLEFLGDNATMRSDMLTPKTCEEFFKIQLKRVKPSMVGNYKVLLSSIYNDAIKLDVLSKNPFSHINIGKLAALVVPESANEPPKKKKPFTREELLIILNDFPAPYCDLGAVGFYTHGQRIGDCIHLRWEQIDFENKIIHLKSKKTQKHTNPLLVPAFEKRLLAIKEKSTDDVYVFPELVAKCKRSKGCISTEFVNLLKAFKIIPAVAEAPKNGIGKPQSSKAFHSFRHTAASVLQSNPHISEATSRALVGHNSKKVHRGYCTALPDEVVKACEHLAAYVE